MFDISASALENAGTIFFSNIEAGKTVVINVTGITGNVTLKGNFSFGSPNDPQAKWRRRSSGISSRPAPPARIRSPRSPTGSARSWRATIMSRTPLISTASCTPTRSTAGPATAPNCTTTNSTAPCRRSAPKASTWAMMLAGFAGLGFVEFRRSRKQPIAAF